jgi:hypothetical protein
MPYIRVYVSACLCFVMAFSAHTLSLDGSTVLWTWLLFSFLNLYIDGRTPLRGGSARLNAATYTQNNINTVQTHIDIHASSWIRTHDLSVRASEEGSRLRPCGHCDPLAFSPNKGKRAKLSLFLIKQHVMKTRRGVEAQLHHSWPRH